MPVVLFESFVVAWVFLFQSFKIIFIDFFDMHIHLRFSRIIVRSFLNSFCKINYNLAAVAYY